MEGSVKQRVLALAVIATLSVTLGAQAAPLYSATRPADCRPTYSLAFRDGVVATPVGTQPRTTKRIPPRTDRDRQSRPCIRLASI